MGVTRILDLIVIMLLATVLLMPRPDATVKPALTLDPERRARVAELQSMLVGQPDAVDASLELANIFLDGHRPDWALATVTARGEVPPERLPPPQPARDRLRRSLRGRSRRSRPRSARSSCATRRRRRRARPRAGTPSRGRLALLAATLRRGVEGRHEEAALPGEGPHLQDAAPDVHPEAEAARRNDDAGGKDDAGENANAGREDRAGAEARRRKVAASPLSAAEAADSGLFSRSVGARSRRRRACPSRTARSATWRSRPAPR